MTRGKIQTISVAIAMAFLGSLLPSVFAQDRDRDRDDRDRDRLTRLEPGTIIPVRNDESIDVERKDNRVYRGTVDQDVRGENGRLAIPRGSEAEMIVRVAPDNDLVIDIESVTVDGRRFAIQTDSNRQESERDNSLVGGLVRQFREEVVGARGFEPPTPWSRTRCATRLRYAPTGLLGAARALEQK